MMSPCILGGRGLVRHVTRSPGGEEAKPIVGGALRGRGPHNEGLFGIVCLDESVPVEHELANNRVIESLGAGVEALDRSISPPLSELRIVYGEFSHEGGQSETSGYLAASMRSCATAV